MTEGIAQVIECLLCKQVLSSNPVLKNKPKMALSKNKWKKFEDFFWFFIFLSR
jgi:hypothetical protein